MAGPTERIDASQEIAARLGLRGPTPAQKSEEEDELKQTVGDLARIVRIKTLRDIAMSPPPSQAPAQTAPGTTKSEESTKLDVAAMFKAMTEQNTALMTQLTGLLKDRTDPQLTIWQKEMEHQTEEIKKEVQAGHMSPTQAMTEYMTLEDQLADRMKKRLGLPEGFHATSQDTGALMQLERMKIDHEQWLKVQDVKMADDNRHWETDRDDRRQTAAQEQKRWEQEFDLKRSDAIDGHRSRERSMAVIEDLGGALQDGIFAKKRGGAAAEPEEPRPRREVVPKKFRCGECGAEIDVEPPGAQVVTCACGQVYDLGPAEPRQEPS